MSIFGKILRNNILKYFSFKILRPQLIVAKDLQFADYIFYHQKFPFTNYISENFNDKINEDFLRVSKSGELEYLLHIKENVFIEPYYNYAIKNGNEVILKSLPYGETMGVPFPHHIYYKNRKVKKLERAICLSYNWENYWHFNNDIIGQLKVLENANISKEIPILVPDKIRRYGYVNHFFRTNYAKRWNWVFQMPNEYYSLEESFFCKGFPNLRETFLFSRSIMCDGVDLSRKGENRIYITRNSNRGRNIENEDELKSMLLRYGFRLLDADCLSVTEQMEEFAAASVILGIHGAGLTNMMYRYGAKCEIIELFSPNYFPPMYFWLAQELSFNYHAICGTQGSVDLFQIDVNEVEDIIKNLSGLSAITKK